jgi:hypothetical protein
MQSKAKEVPADRKAAINYSNADKINHQVVDSMLKGTRKSMGPVC